MKLERYFMMICVLVVACCFAVGCEQMQKPTMDMVGMVTDPETPETPETPEMPTDPTTPTDPAVPTDPTTPTDPAVPTDPETPTEPETPADPYANLPKLTFGVSTELEPGSRYRVEVELNVGRRSGKAEYINASVGKEGDRLSVRIIFDPLPLSESISQGEEIVIEVGEKIEVVDTEFGGLIYTAHHYKGKVIKNLSRPEIVFEDEEDETEDDDG